MQRFAAVIMRIREPKTTALIFASGKMVSTAHLPQAVSIAPQFDSLHLTAFLGEVRHTT